MASIGIVVGDTAAGAAEDTAILNKITEWGHTGTLVDDSSATIPTTYAGYVISPTASSGTLAAKMDPAFPKPVLSMSYTTAGPTGQGLTSVGQATVTGSYNSWDIITTDPLGSAMTAAGVADPATVFTSNQGLLSTNGADIKPEAKVAARPSYDATRATAYYYDAGAPSYSGTSPTFAAKRAQFMTTKAGVLAATTDYWRIAKVLLDWALGTAVAPTVTVGADVTAGPGDEFVLTATGSPSGGTYAWTQTAGAAAALNDSTSPSPSGTAPGTAGTLTYQVIYTRSGIASAPATVDVTVLSAATVIRPTAAGATTGWTAVGGTIPAVLADTSDGSYVESSVNPSGQVLVLKYATATDPALSVGYQTRVRAYQVGAASSSMTVQVVEADSMATVTGGGGTVRATRTATNLPTAPTWYTWALTSGEADSIVDHSKLYRRVTVTAA